MGKRNTFFHVTFSEPVTKAGSGSTLDHDNFASSFSSSTTVEELASLTKTGTTTLEQIKFNITTT